MSRLISSLNDIMFNHRNAEWIRFWYVCYLYAWIYLNIITTIIRPTIRHLIGALIRPIIRHIIRKWTCALTGALIIRKCLSCYVELWSYILFWLYIINKTQSRNNLLMPYL